MMSTIQMKCQWALKIALLIALILAMVPGQPGRAADLPYTVYLPLISKSPTGISGLVTLNGIAAPVEEVWLCYKVDNPPITHVCQWSFYTDSYGQYFFDSSILVPGRIYATDCHHFSESYRGELFYWRSKDLDPYLANSNIVMETFDMADVPLTSPSEGATISLPHNFQWGKRSTSPSDSYKILLYNSGTGFESPLQGYVSSYLLNYLPGGFSPNLTYSWSVGIVSPGSGYGLAYYENQVTFSNSGSSLQPGFTQGSLQPFSFDGKGSFIFDELRNIRYILGWRQ